MNKKEKIYLKIPVDVIYENDHCLIIPNTETESLLGSHHLGIHGSGKTKEEAEEKFFILFRMIQDMTWKDHLELDLWKPFKKGDWKQTGGKWFIIYGFQFYFRVASRGKKFMKGGWFLPYTNLNISILNLWKLRRSLIK